MSCGESFKDLRDLCEGNRVLIEVKIFQDWTLYVSTVFDVLSRFCSCEGFPVVAKRTAKDVRGSIVGPPDGTVVMISQLPCTSALLSVTFYCKSTHDP